MTGHNCPDHGVDDGALSAVMRGLVLTDIAVNGLQNWLICRLD
jgi:hypothetical protein